MSAKPKGNFAQQISLRRPKENKRFPIAELGTVGPKETQRSFDTTECTNAKHERASEREVERENKTGHVRIATISIGLSDFRFGILTS